MRSRAVLTIFLCVSPATAAASLPDLCDDVHLDPTGSPYTDSTGFKLSRFCEWTHVFEVTPWADHVCCSIGSTASCKPTDAAGRCATGAKMWCDYATLSNGVVTCQQPWPDACEAGFCSAPDVGSTPLEDTEPLCCPAPDDCFVVDPGNLASCNGQFVGCEAPFTNNDGSVGCSDDE